MNNTRSACFFSFSSPGVSSCPRIRDFRVKNIVGKMTPLQLKVVELVPCLPDSDRPNCGNSTPITPDPPPLPSLTFWVWSGACGWWKPRLGDRVPLFHSRRGLKTCSKLLAVGIGKELLLCDPSCTRSPSSYPHSNISA